MTETQLQLAAAERPSQRLLVVIGVLWLVLAAVIIITQLSTPPPVRIDWQTETEIETAGFNVYRSESADGEYVRLNEALIPSVGSATSGSTYSFADESASPGAVYYYRLEDVELDNSSTQHDVIAFTAPYVAWWVPLVAALSVLCGLFLIVKGLVNP